MCNTQNFVLCSSCAQSGNPYCGWKSGYCLPIPPEDRSSYEQDLFEENIYKDNIISNWDVVIVFLCSR